MTAQRKRGARAAGAAGAAGARGARGEPVEQEWLTTAQVAVLYGVTRQRVQQMITEGKIEGDKTTGRWRVSRRWLDAQHAASGGLYPAADGRGLTGFLAEINEWDEPFVRQLVYQEAHRALVKAFGLFVEATALQHVVEGDGRGAAPEAPKRRRTG